MNELEATSKQPPMKVFVLDSSEPSAWVDHFKECVALSTGHAMYGVETVDESLTMAFVGNGPSSLQRAHLFATAQELLEVIEAIMPLLGGWREVIATLDDMPKGEALGKAMWACLDQIDASKEDIRAAIAKARGESR